MTQRTITRATPCESASFGENDLNLIKISILLRSRWSIHRGLKKPFPFLCGNLDELVKSRNSKKSVIPAKAGIQLFQDVLDPGFRRGDDPRDFLRDHQSCLSEVFWNHLIA